MTLAFRVWHNRAPRFGSGRNLAAGRVLGHQLNRENSMDRFFRPLANVIGVLALLVLGAGAQAQEISRVSVSSAGVEGNNESSHPSMSANGRFVLFKSDASNLVADDINGARDLFVRDLLLGRTELVSVPPPGVQFLNGADLWSSAQDGSISADGSLVLFMVQSNEECPSQIYLRDRAASLTTCINIGSAPVGANDYAISADGKWIAISSGGIFLMDRTSGAVTQLAVTAESFFGLSLSADAGVLAFAATELVLDGAGNALQQQRLYTFERATGNVVLVESDLRGDNDINISGDGRFLGFTLGAVVSDPIAGDSYRSDIWVLDRVTGARELITNSPAGAPSDEESYYPNLSHDGRFVAFDSHASNLTDPGLPPGRGLRVYFFDRQTRQMTLLSKVKNGAVDVRVSGANPSISADGRYVAFRSRADNLVLGDTNAAEDTFLWDRLATSGAPIALSAAASPTSIWPPNKRMVNVAVKTEVTGANGAVALSLRIEDEYGELTRPFAPWSGATVQLEASRRGNDPDGRLYTIVVQATDASGQRAETRTRVIVPHDQRPQR
jgi:Tol biopolymer transport system component